MESHLIGVRLNEVEEIIEACLFFNSPISSQLPKQDSIYPGTNVVFYHIHDTAISLFHIGMKFEQNKRNKKFLSNN